VAFSFAPDGIEVARIGGRSVVRISAHSKVPDYVVFARRSERVLLSLARKERRAKLWKCVGGDWEEVAILSRPNDENGHQKISTVEFNATERLIVASTEGSVMVWDAKTGEVWCEVIRGEFTERCTQALPHPRHPGVIAVATERGRVSLWDISRRGHPELIAVLHSDEGPEIVDAIWSPDGTFLVCASSAGSTTLYKEVEYLSTVPSTEMFFLSEITLATEAQDEIVDRHGQPLIPQPRRFSLTALVRGEMKPPSRVTHAAHGERAAKTGSEEEYSSDETSPLTERRARATRSPSGEDRQTLTGRRRTPVVPHSPPREERTPRPVRRRTRTDPSSPEREEEGPPMTRTRTPTVREEPSGPRGPRNTQAAGPTSSATAVELFEVPEFFFGVERCMHSYVPQIGERVAYLRTGHRDWLSKCDLPDFVPPYVMHPELPPISYASVINIDFFLTHVLLELSFDDFVARVPYHVPPCPPFIVSDHHFARSVDYARHLNVGQIVTAYCRQEKAIVEHCAKVMEPPSLDPDPYDSIKVVFTDDNTHGNLQPWELLFEKKPDRKESAAMQMCQRLLGDVRTMIEDQKFAIVKRCRSLEWRKTCLRCGCQPMDLVLIADRLEHNYYATPASILMDVVQLERTTAAAKRGVHAGRMAAERLIPRIEAMAAKVGLPLSGDLLNGDEFEISSED
jgi:hypothetical protein